MTARRLASHTPSWWHPAAIDIKRANNAVDDGSGIKRATPVSLRHNVINIRVEASDISVHQHHIVRIRFEEWDQMVDDIAEDDKSALKITKSLCAGRVSFDCDCGRHQYWYRYIATAGNFAPHRQKNTPIQKFATRSCKASPVNT